MPSTEIIDLGDHYQRFIDQQIAAGRYHTAADVLESGLRLLEEREVKLATLRTALIEGETSGPSISPICGHWPSSP